MKLSLQAIPPKVRKAADWCGRAMGMRRRRSKVDPGASRILETVQRVCQELRDSMPVMEGTFLKVGEQLEQLHTRSVELTGKCEELLHFAAGSQEGVELVRTALAALKGPLEYIDFCMNEHERLLELLRECEQQTHAMLGVRRQMHDAIAPLTFMSVLFKIESAYLPDDLKETFSTVTVEVERLHSLVDETFAKNAQQLEDAHKTLSSVRLRLQEDFRKHVVEVGGKRTRIDSAINSLDAQLAQNAERDTRLHSHGASLASEVGKVVTGVQFQDIVKQKVDHIIEGLQPRGNRITAPELSLQIEHLRTVNQDLDTGCSSVRDGLARITDLTEQLNHSSVSLENFEGMTAAVDGMVQLILDVMQDVHDIISLVSRLTEQGHAAVLPASGLARNLTSTISELSINMRLIALNAQIRSVQGGQGTGLEMLAARTAEISDQINDISVRVAGDLQRLHAQIDEMLGKFSEFLDRGKLQNEALGAARASVEPGLHALRNKTLELVQEIGDSVDLMHEAVSATGNSLAELPGLGTKLKSITTELEAVRPEGDIHAGDLARLKGLADRYTMASEREVHDNLLAALAAGSAQQKKDESTVTPIEAAAAATAAVDLFGDTGAEATKTEAGSAEKTPETTPKAPAPDKAADSNSGNIELF